MNLEAKKTNENILNQWKNIEKEFSQLSKMTRDILIVSTAEIKCERVFNTAEVVYDHYKSYNSKTFSALMMIRFHDWNENLQTKLNANLLTKKNLTNKNMKKKMKKRMFELKNVYNKLYINENDENDFALSTTAWVLIEIRLFILVMLYMSRLI
jgi:uncharacterized protein Veg